MEHDSFLHVVAAVIDNDCGEVLLALRPREKHQGGLWEFPGGKVEAGETVRAALRRELKEELDIEVEQARPLIQVRHRYPDRNVVLDVWRVERFTGQPRGCEGQLVEWVALDDLATRAFPAANLPIVAAARLPERYLITPEPTDPALFLMQLESALAQGVSLVQLRAKSLSPADYRALAEQVLSRCRARGARLLLNAEPALAVELGADGVHLGSQALLALEARPLPASMWVGASCHDAAELARAQGIGADFAVLGPVAPTASHPQAEPMGWSAFEALVNEVAMPVYALGGVSSNDLDQAYQRGAQGIAAIRALWSSAEFSDTDRDRRAP